MRDYNIGIRTEGRSLLVIDLDVKKKTLAEQLAMVGGLNAEKTNQRGF